MNLHSINFFLLKKSAIIIIIAISYASNSYAQLVIRQESNIPQYYLKVGYGITSYYNNKNDYSSSLYFKNNKSTGPFYLKFDYNAEYDMTFGIIIGFEKQKADYASPYYCNCTIDAKYEYQAIDVLFKMNYILRPDKNVQPYFGFSSGLRSKKVESISNIYQYEQQYVERKTVYAGDIDAGINVIIKKGLGIYLELNLINTVGALGLFDENRSYSYFQFGLVKTINNH